MYRNITKNIPTLMLFLNLCKAFDSGRRVARHKRWQLRLEGVWRVHKGRETFERRYEWIERRSDRAVSVREPPATARPRLTASYNTHEIALILCKGKRQQMNGLHNVHIWYSIRRLCYTMRTTYINVMYVLFT